MFTGLRAGFFFIPDFGYRQAPPAYQHRVWRAGQRLPRWFWRYAVRDYYHYDLPRPPEGCLWVWVDHDMALIDGGDGYILDIVRGAW